MFVIVGFAGGAAAASAAFLFTAAKSRKVLEVQKHEREQVMQSVGMLLAEAEAVQTNYRCGTLGPESFRRSLNEKSGAVKRLLRANMHILDVFFVKYAEQEADEYIRVAETPERRRIDGPAPETFPAPSAAFAEPAAFEQFEKFDGPIDTAIIAREIAIDSKFGAKQAIPLIIDPKAPPPPPIKVDEDRSTFGGNVFGDDDAFVPEPEAPTVPPEEPITEVFEVAVTSDVNIDFAPAADTAAEPEIDDSFVPTYTPAEPEESFAPAIETPAPETRDVFAPVAVAEPVKDEPFAPVIDTVAEADFDDTFAPAAPVMEPAVAVFEEELVFGESPDAFVPPPVVSAPAFAPAPVAVPAAAPATEADIWDERSLEEFEAAFAHFEEPSTVPAPAAPPAPVAAVAPPPQAYEGYSETSRYPVVGEVFGGDSAPLPTFAPVPPQQPYTAYSPNDPAETNAVEKSAVFAAAAAIPQEGPSTGITGDDIADTIDNLFNLG